MHIMSIPGTSSFIYCTSSGEAKGEGEQAARSTMRQL